MGKLSYRDGARQDLISTYRRYAREAGVRLADRFLASAESRFRRLAGMPGIGTIYDLGNPLVGELRFLRLTARFRHYNSVLPAGRGRDRNCPRPSRRTGYSINPDR